MKEMSVIVKRNIPIAIVASMAIVLVIDYFFKQPSLDFLGSTFKDWGVICAAFALFLGLANISRVHVMRITRRSKNWWLSIWTILIMVIFFILGVIDLRDPTYVQWYTIIRSGIGTTTNSILAFYISSAAYRALRAKTGEAAVLMTAAIFAMMFNAPIGGAIHPILPAIGKWILDVPDAAAFRGIILGIATGTLALGIRMILGMETGYLGAREEG